jgi:hypothetical protein
LRRGSAPSRQQLEAGAAPALSVRQLRTIPGIGLLTATGLVAAVGDVQRFPSARHFASYLGLTPREDSTGPRRRLAAISKRGDTYLRMLLIHGARSVLCRAKTQTASPPDRLRAWALQVERLRGTTRPPSRWPTSWPGLPGWGGDMARITWELRPSESGTERGDSSSLGDCCAQDDVRAHRL